jgi:dTDP-4-dehydrorhamnose reductase
MKIAVTGHKGRIGSELVSRGITPLKCDITNLEETTDAIHSVSPDVIIHCAAKTNVAWCEDDKNYKKAYGVNVRGTANLFHDFEGTVIYLSTVHVFNGQKYFKYSEKHKPDPPNMYGLTKWSGEVVANAFSNPARSVIVRTSRTFDWDFIESGVKDELGRGRYKDYTTLIKRSFCHTSHFVDGLLWLVDNLDKYPDLGLLHIAGTDMLSYYDFWIQVANMFGFDNQLVVPRTQKIKESPRPFRGGLNVNKAKKMGMPLFSAVDGLKFIRDNM